MNTQIVTINGRARRGFQKYGRVFVRCFVDLEAEEADKFCKKCDYFARADSDMLRDLVKGFNVAFGCGEGVKSPGDLFDRGRTRRIIEEAVSKTVQEVAKWKFSTN